MGGPNKGFASLSEREREIHACLVLDLTDQQIAERLVLSLPTVKTHVRSILRKLGVRSRHQAAEIHE